MKARKDPTEEQLLHRLQRQLGGTSHSRARNDSYWALRHQGYSHAFACRAFRDSLPRYYRQELQLSGEYIDDIDPADLLFVPPMTVDFQKLAVLVRPDLTEEAALSAPPRSTEYTIWSHGIPGFGVRIRPSGVKTYIVMFRHKGGAQQGKISLGKPGILAFDLARRMACEARLEAMAGNDPRQIHKSGDLLRRSI